MNKIIDILDTKWERGNKRLKALKMTLSFNQRIIKIKFNKKKEISKIIKFDFFDLDPKNQRWLKQDLKREFKFNKKECKRTLKINKKMDKVVMNSTYLLH